MDSIEILSFSRQLKNVHLMISDTFTSTDVVYTTESAAHRTIEQRTTEQRSIEVNVKKPVASIEEFYDVLVKRTYKECINEFNAPQRSLLWHNARKYSITASNFGAAIGNNKYSSPEMCIKEKLWSSFRGNEFTEYGTFHEKDAQQSFLNNLEYLRPTLEDILPGFETYTFFETGLLKHPDCPWIAVSPDGLLKLNSKDSHKWALIEFKCPARKRHSKNHPYANDNNVPRYYFDQVQGICGLLNEKPDILKMVSAEVSEISDIFFVVWQPEQIHITRLKYDHDYYVNTLKPGLESWYFKQFLPLAYLKYIDQLIENTLDIDTSK